MAEEKKEKKQKSDSLFEKVSDYISGTIRIFAAFLFLLFGLGAVYGALLAPLNPFFVLVPLILAIIAYYSRDFAVIVIIIAVLALFALTL